MTDLEESVLANALPEDEQLARIIAVALGFAVDTCPDECKTFTKTDCFRAADAVIRHYQRIESGRIAELEGALKHYSNRDNWVGNRYRGTIHGPAVAEQALASEG